MCIARRMSAVGREIVVGLPTAAAIGPRHSCATDERLGVPAGLRSGLTHHHHIGDVLPDYLDVADDHSSPLWTQGVDV